MYFNSISTHDYSCKSNSLSIHFSPCQSVANSYRCLILGLWLPRWLRGFTDWIWSSIPSDLLSKMPKSNLLQVCHQYALRPLLWSSDWGCCYPYPSRGICKLNNRSKFSCSCPYLLNSFLPLSRKNIRGLWNCA